MARLPAKFSAHQIHQAGGWPLPELVGDKTISTKSPNKDRKISARDTVRRVPASSQSETPKATVQQPGTAAPQTTLDDDASQIETLLDIDSDGTQHNDEAPRTAASEDREGAEGAEGAEGVESVESAEGVESAENTANEQSYDAGFKKGETEGYVKGEQAGYEAGLEAGTNAGREAAEKAFNEEIATQRGVLNNLIQAFTNPPDPSAEYEQALLPLIVQITQVVLMGELKTEHSHIQRLIQQAISALPHGAQNCKAFVNPSDLAWLEDSVRPEIELVADAALARGGCRIENAESKVDASIADRLHEALVATWGSEEEIEQISEQALQQIESDLES